MRRFFAFTLLLLSLSLFYGHHVVYVLLNSQLDREWSAGLSGTDTPALRQYRASWPVSLPYQPDQADYVASKGSFELYGIHYRVLKQRYMRDTLHVVYTPDIKKNRLDFGYRHLLKAIGGIEATGNGVLSCLKLMAAHYYPVSTDLIINPSEYDSENFLPFWEEVAYTVYTSIPSPPPKS